MKTELTKSSQNLSNLENLKLTFFYDANNQKLNSMHHKFQEEFFSLMNKQMKESVRTLLSEKMSTLRKFQSMDVKLGQHAFGKEEEKGTNE
jgi:hypothetical protein